LPARGPRAGRWPRISVVTPSYNQGQFIEETIRSVLLQGYPELEYIVVDGGSTNRTLDVIRRYDQYLDGWVSEPDRGQAHAINKGLAAASGDIQCYLNSDDIFLPGALAGVARNFATARRPVLLCAAGRYFGPAIGAMRRRKGADPRGPARSSRPPARQRITPWLTTCHSVFQPATFWDRRIFELLGGFREDMSFCFDKDFFLRAIFQLGAYRACPDLVASGHRLHDACKTVAIPDGMHAENEVIWHEYASQSWCAALLRHEQRESDSLAGVRRSLEAGPAWRRGKTLLESVSVWPPVLRDRAFWGAARRILLGRS